MLAPFTTASRRTPHYHSPGVATVVSHATYASMSTRTTTTTTTRDRGDCYGPMEWAQSEPEGTQLLPTCHTKVNTMWLLGSSRCVHQRRLQWGSGCNLHPLWHKGRISLIGGGREFHHSLWNACPAYWHGTMQRRRHRLPLCHVDDTQRLYIVTYLECCGSSPGHEV